MHAVAHRDHHFFEGEDGGGSCCLLSVNGRGDDQHGHAVGGWAHSISPVELQPWNKLIRPTHARAPLTHLKGIQGAETREAAVPRRFHCLLRSALARSPSEARASS